MVKKMVVLDKEMIIPTNYPRKASAMDLARAKKLEDIDFSDVVFEEFGDQKTYIKFGHHRTSRALELAPGATIEVEVIEATKQAKLDIEGALRQFAQNGEIRNMDEFIERTKWLRGEK